MRKVGIGFSRYTRIVDNLCNLIKFLQALSGSVLGKSEV